MALFDFIKKQFIDVIHWTEDDPNTLSYRYPMQDFEIQNGASLTVRESQMALFVNEGVAADAFGPGTHKLSTQTLPLLTNLKNWDKLFQSPFKSDVYFFNTRLQLDRKWGTPNPITLRDPEFGILRIRAFGIYSFRIADPKVFHKEIAGTRERCTLEDLDGQLRNLIIAGITETIAESKIPFLDMAANQSEFSAKLSEGMAPLFSRYGLALDTFALQNLSLPEELQKVLDQRIGMNLAGDLNKLTQYNVAQSIPIAAANESGMAGVGASLSAGMVMAQTMAQNMANAMQPAPAPAATPAAAPADDVFATIEKLHGLMTKGILSPEEFAAKKAELLSKM